MPTINTWSNQVLAADVLFNGGKFEAGTDATSGAINLGTGAAARTVTLGNGTGATSVVVDCGTGALNLGTNAIARTTTLGNTTGASVLALKYGTGDFTLASATGTVMSALDTGEVTMPLQPAFLASAAAQNNVTGDNTAYTVVFAEVYDRNGDYDGTSTFTAPVTGIYAFTTVMDLIDWNVAITRGNFNIITSNRAYSNFIMNWYPVVNANEMVLSTSTTTADLDAGDTCTVRINFQNGAKQIDISSGIFCGVLLN